jgi:ferredoxin
MMSVEIYYFSGTGNSLHVARELQKRIPEAKLIPIVHLLNQEVIETQSEIVGFVFPIYLMTVPVPVRRFLKNLDPKSARYLFAVPTHTGHPGPGFATIYIDKILRKKGKSLNSYLYLHMANNSPTGLVPPSMPGFKEQVKDWVNQISPEKIAALELPVQNQLETFYQAVVQQVKYPKKTTYNGFYRFLEYFISRLSDHPKTEIPFYADATCTGCGICEQVCLSRKIKMLYDNPVWQKDVQCYFCFACYNACPQQAILHQHYTDKNGRYIHPRITAGDIAGQK